MARFDRYMLSQLMVLFGFFALILVSIYWINSAVRMFDRLVGDGQPAWVFLEFSALTLPGVIRLVLPMAAFAGAVYVTNRMSTESELTVVQATGYSPWRLARPVLVYGLIVAAMMSVLTHYLVPKSLGQLREREVEISRNITAKFLTEGEFLHPAPGITFYIREITPEGTLENVFLSDRRQEDSSVTYTSDIAYLVQDGVGTKLVMIDGLAQTASEGGNRLFTTQFEDFSYDISSLIPQEAQDLYAIPHASTLDLIRDPEAQAERTGTPVGRVVEELHGRFHQPLLCAVAALIGFATLMLGGFSRFGVIWQIVGAFFLLVLVKFVEGVTTAPVRANPEMWPLIYTPSIFGLIVAGAMLYIAANPGLFRRKVRGAAA